MRGALASLGSSGEGLVLVALSGGPDSLALAAATAFEAPRAGLRAGAVVVDHGLQAGSADVAARAAEQARELGLDPVVVRRVEVGAEGGPEAAARTARYAALADAAVELGASAVLLGHTLDDQAETVLLGLARGSGSASLSGMAPVSWSDRDGYLRPDAANAPARQEANAASGRNREGEGSATAPDARFAYLRPLLGIRRATTLQFCVDSGLEPWHDPQNGDPAFARVRVRETILPMLEAELGPGIAEALARTAEQSREDSEALDHFADEQAEELAEHAEAGLSLSVKGLEHNPAALRQRIIRLAVASEFGVSLSRAQTLEVARLVTDWHGQGELHLPGIRVVRQGALLVFSAAGGGQGRGSSNEGTPRA
ncbi:tRNA lysidine(34) synthetase TilS [Leifsonia bigeumensis]|uniref:tRNA(Ile)-lysidine synthase n=1 Tax=Leifsonella bigeumensis TaxID=433643 RepID=A0ABP7F1R2_9MICO